jgi:hypothetical protein
VQDGTTKSLLSLLLERKDMHNLEKEDVIAILTDLIIGGVDTVNIYFLIYFESKFLMQ